MSDSENAPVPNSASEPTPETSAAVSANASSVTEAANSASNEGLPEWEPLTPELVEDEAIRGDFMLRWAVVLLALLIGCRQIVETTTLVQVKTGQYLVSHGFWPPGKDVFSATATEHRWVNLSWLWDVISSGLFSIGSGVGLSLATAVIVALTWWLLGKTSRLGVSTWWGSILGGLTLLTCHPQFSGRPETITLLGLAATSWLLHTWRSSSDAAVNVSLVAKTSPSVSLWWLVPGFVLWSNLDHRMFLGLVLLLLWGLGETIGNTWGRGALTAAQRKHFWKVLGTCLVASFLNPFGGLSLWSPVALYGTEYPAWRAYASASSILEESGVYSLWTPALWHVGPNRLPLTAGIVVLGAALVSLVLNARRANLGDVFTFAGFVALASVASHELAAASLVACVIGTLNAQQWYQATFRQAYSIAPSELLFTRGGRAITVLAFFALAVMAVNQSLFGAEGKRVGLGLSQHIQALIDAYREATADSFDDHPFNFVPKQGDVLLWVDQKPFMDSRLSVFAGRGDEDLLALHETARRSLAGFSAKSAEADHELERSTADGDRSAWRPIFDRFQITHAMPRLVGARLDAYFQMLHSSEWRLTHLGANCAVFYRETRSAELQKFLAEHRLQFVKSAARTESSPSLRTEWPHVRTSYQKYFAPAETRVSNAVRQAENLLMHLHVMAGGQISIDQPTAVAMAILAIRKANVGLAESADLAAAYQVLGDAYSFLLGLETSIQQSSGVPFSNQLRFYQALGAYHQALLLEPNSLELHDRLLELLRRHNRLDLVLRELDEIDRLMPPIADDDVGANEAQQRRLQLREECQSRLDSLRAQFDKGLDEGQSPIALAEQIYAVGFVREARKLLDQDRAAVNESAPAQILQGLLRFEEGEVEEAYHQFEFESESNPAAWRIPAAWTRLAHGDYDSTVGLWKDQMELSRLSSLTSMLLTLPLIQSPFQQLGQPSVWPSRHWLMVGEAQTASASEIEMLLCYSAMCYLEAGRPRLAAKTLHGLLETHPETSLRPLARFYLFLIEDELVDLEPPSDWIPVDGETFMPDESDTAKSAEGKK